MLVRVPSAARNERSTASRSRRASCRSGRNMRPTVGSAASSAKVGLWSGRRESNSRDQFGRLRTYVPLTCANTGRRPPACAPRALTRRARTCPHIAPRDGLRCAAWPARAPRRRSVSCGPTWSATAATSSTASPRTTWTEDLDDAPTPQLLAHHRALTKTAPRHRRREGTRPAPRSPRHEEDSGYRARLAEARTRRVITTREPLNIRPLLEAIEDSAVAASSAAMIRRLLELGRHLRAQLERPRRGRALPAPARV